MGPKTSSTSTIEKTSETFDNSSPTDFYGLFIDTSKPANKDEEAKVKTIKQKLLDSKGVLLKDAQIQWALRSQVARGDVDTTLILLNAMSDASEGLLTSFNPSVRLKGAVNRQAVTCFLDSTLFSMFSRLDSFEAMLYNSFEDVAKERLAFLLRLWVNMLRSGLLITTDVTRDIQESLAECGWEDARELQQQDASEAFTFITEKLNLPLLTLKMDIYHTGKQDTDDHKFIKERLLEVAIPTLENGEHPAEIKLEDCLEEYFNNRIEVKRYLERRNTLQSTKSNDKAVEAGMAVHVETLEVDPEASTPLTPLSPMPSYMSQRPVYRHRAPSIIQERYIPDKSEKVGSPMNDPKAPTGRLRTGSVRKEVLMPAWQFFSLIPWYTDNAPSNDAQVAAHFSSKRPVLGLCLKRYAYTNQGQAIRLNTVIDIPLEIGLPHFIQDDKVDEEGPIYGNFKLSLQSVVCHRGISVDSGHYVALVRSNMSARDSEEEMSQWLRFDDLASQRISLVDIHRALKEETPYLLFYQILPVDGDPGNLTSGEKPAPGHSTSTTDMASSEVSSAGEPLVAAGSVEAQSARQSVDVESFEDSRGRAPNGAKRRPSAISFTEHLSTPARSSVDVSADPAPTPEHKKSGSFGDGLSKTFSKLASRSKRNSKEDLRLIDQVVQAEGGPPIHVDEIPMPTPSDSVAVDTVRSKSEPTPSTPAPTAHHQTGTPGGVSRSRSKREKSRSRLLKPGKSKDDPDRECVVM
ncbi:hypothetical protein PMZ80_002648 [Knufia obscura]|uniref:ubiquitinyl hydrolase 1 n=1 Tax=Knufia obscura TaxID=1635080 RepID=A0ABR0RYU4_9EURO|nr:hypothetical protein PMZ80_002648 [Knufia obscura]